LKVGGKCGTEILRDRLTRACKDITLCRTWKQEGRMAVSETDLRRSNRLRGRELCKPWWNAIVDWTYRRQQSWRAYCGYERGESAEKDADLRRHHAGVGELARMAAVRRLHPCSVKSSAHELYSPRLEYLDIAGVMRSFCKEFGERRKVQVDFKSHDLPGLVMPDITLCLFRVLQEALRNAVKRNIAGCGSSMCNCREPRRRFISRSAITVWASTL
jgi:hypothetical protein